jgi:hypothetical protein
MSRHVINGIRNHYQNAQTKLKKGESYLKDRVAIHYQMTRNDLVMQLYVGFPKEISPRKQQLAEFFNRCCMYIHLGSGIFLFWS